MHAIEVLALNVANSRSAIGFRYVWTSLNAYKAMKYITLWPKWVSYNIVHIR